MSVTVRLHPLRSGVFRATHGWFVRQPGPLASLKALGLGAGTIETTVISFLVEHPAHGPVLIDSGLDPAAPEDMNARFGRLNALVFRGMRVAPEGPVREQLAERGVDPDAVRTILMTHLHADHASGLAKFPQATVHVTRREWEAAHAKDAGRQGYHGPQFAGVEPELLDLAEGDELDFFGDGSVLLFATPGHTKGHASVLVRTGSGPVLVAGDAIYTMENLQEGREPLKMVSRSAYRRSVGRLRAVLASEPGAVVVPGHDLEHWRTLENVY